MLCCALFAITKIHATFCQFKIGDLADFERKTGMATFAGTWPAMGVHGPTGLSPKKV